MQTSRLIQGTMGLGGSWGPEPLTTKDIDQAQSVIETAMSRGITTFDHANIYTQGKAEAAFGHYLNNNPHKREDMFLQSKAGIVLENATHVGHYNFEPDHLIEEVDGILSRLNTNYLDRFLLHRPDPLMDIKALKKVIDNLFQTEKIRGFGVSNMSPYQMAWLSDRLERKIEVNQIEMSLLKLDWLDAGVDYNTDRSAGLNQVAGTVEYCQHHDIELQAWSSMGRGVFTGAPLGPDLSPAILATKEVVADLAKEKNTSPEAVVLAFLLRHPAGIRPIIGTANPKRIEACSLAENLALSRQEWYRLYVTSRGVRVP